MALEFVEKNYPVTTLMPKFLLLNSLCIGKTMGKDTFAASLNQLVERYPSSDVTTMAKDILALINQGNIPSEGTSVGGLMALREEARREEAAENGVTASHGFTVNYQTPYFFKLITDTTKVNQNKLLYETAMYNFTKFLIKDFDIQTKGGVLTVSGLDNYDEALWYINGIIADDGIQKLLRGSDYKYLLITQENLDLIGRGYTIEQYEKFYKDSIASRKRNNNVSVQLVGEEKEIEEIKSEQVLDIKEGDNLNGASFKLENKETKDEEVEQPKETEEENKSSEEMKRSESKVNEIKPLPSDDAMQKKVVEVPPSVEAQSKKELKK